MSTIGLGAVVAVPAVAVGGAAIAAIAVVGTAVAVGGVGVVVAQQAGKAVLACGKEMKLMAEQNRAMQHSLQQAAQRYEQQLQQQERERRALSQAELRRWLQDQRETTRRRQQRLAKMRQMQTAPVEAMIDWDAIAKTRDEILAAEGPSGIVTLHRMSGWENRLERMGAMMNGLRQRLDYFVSGPGSGLFVLAGLSDIMQEAETQLRALEADSAKVMLGSATVPAGAVESLLVTLEFLDARLHEMRTQIPHRRSERLAAIEVLDRANQALERAMDAPDAADYLVGVEMVQGMLTEAQAKLDEAKFERARSMAEAILRHLEHIEQTVAQQRQKNLQVLLQTYQSSVKPLQELPELADRVAAWEEESSRIDILAQQDVVRAWSQATKPEIGLFANANELQQEALSLLLKQQSNTLGALSQESLRELGYQIVRTTEDGGSPFIEGHLGKQHMYVTLSESGEMLVKADGFGDASCQPEMKRFLQLLQDKGVQGAWQEKFILTDASQRLLRILQEAGLNARIEPTDNGVTVVASGALTATGQIDFDGREVISEELMSKLWQNQVQSGMSYAEIIQEMDDEWVRHQNELNRRFQETIVQEVAR